jgi:hypothetical protein
MRTVSLASLKLLLSLAAVVASAPAHAVFCGDVLYGSVALTADLVCGPGRDGLIIGADGVRIDLNGFSIIGPYTFAVPTAPATGVTSSKFERVQIVGPGTIMGFERSVAIDGGINHLIRRVDILSESGLPASVRNASGSRIQMSRITALEIASDPGFRATANHITDNEIGADPGLPGGGIFLLGCDTADNMVAGNFINPGIHGAPIPGVPLWGIPRAVTVSIGAHANQILKNKIESSEVLLHGASNNVIAGNDFRQPPTFGYLGVQIHAGYVPVPCAGNVLLPSTRNIVRSNRMGGGTTGVLIDDLSYMGGATANLVTGNSFSNHIFDGVYFGYGATNNDARYNTYTNVPVYVQDYGIGNLW